MWLMAWEDEHGGRMCTRNTFSNPCWLVIFSITLRKYSSLHTLSVPMMDNTSIKLPYLSPSSSVSSRHVAVHFWVNIRIILAFTCRKEWKWHENYSSPLVTSSFAFGHWPKSDFAKRCVFSTFLHHLSPKCVKRSPRTSIVGASFYRCSHVRHPVLNMH